MSTTREYIDGTIQSVVEKFGRSRPGKKRKRPSRLKPLAHAFVEPLENRTLLSVSILNGGGSGYVGDANPGDGGDPPDTTGAAGPDSYIETTNAFLSIFSPKATGTTVVSQTPLNFFYAIGGLSTLGTGATEGPSSDVTMVYDNLMGGTGRFIVGDIDVDLTQNVSQYVFAVSTSNDPTNWTKQDWNFYQVATTEGSPGNSSWSDFPGNPGYNADAFVETFNMFHTVGTTNFGTGCQVITFNASDLASGVSEANLHYYKSDVPGGAQQYRPTTMQDSVPGDPMWLIHNGNGGTEDGSTIQVVKMINVLSNSPSFSTTPLTLSAADQFNPLPVFPQNPDTTTIETASVDELAGNSGDTTNSAGKIDDRILKAAEYNDIIVATNSVPVGTAFLVAASLQLDSNQNPEGGSGYQVGDVLTVSDSDGTFTSPATLTVDTIGAGGSVATVTVNTPGNYSNTVGINGTMTGGHGSGAKFNFQFGGQRDAEWYAFNVSSGTPTFQLVSGVPNVGQIGYGPNTSLYYPGIAINSAGQIGLSFMESDTVGGAVNSATGGYVSTFVTARLSTDPAGTMESPVLVPDGTGYGDIGYSVNGVPKGDRRSGDFSGLSVDPTNGTFWAANEFGVGASQYDTVGDPADVIVNFSPTVNLFAYLSGTTLEIPGLGNNNNSLTVSLSGGTYSVTDITAGGPLTLYFSASAVQSINIALGSGTNTLELGEGNLTGIAPTTVNMGTGNNNALTIDDSQYNVNSLYTLSSRFSGVMNLSRPGTGNIVYTNEAQTVNLIAGSAENGIDVQQATAGIVTDITTSGGVDSVNLGFDGFVDGIRGRLFINSGGEASIDVNDSADTATQTVTLAGASTGGFNEILGLSPAEIDFNYDNTADGITINLGSGGNLVSDHGTNGVPTTFSGGDASSIDLYPAATATASGLTISGGKSSGLVNYGNLSVTNSTISNNTSSTFGGAGVLNGGTLIITDSVISGNSTTQNGGGIQNVRGGNLTLVNTVISGNTANGDGGGVYNQGALGVYDSTFTGNDALGGGSALYNIQDAYASLANSILWGDPGGEIFNNASDGSMVYVQYSDVQGGYTGFSGANNINPAANPDFTSSTNFQLLSTSPCIGTGSNALVPAGLTTDLAGNNRFTGGIVDMGAYQFQGPFPTPTLVFAQGPAAVDVGNPFAQAIAVNIETNNQVDSGDTSTVTLTIASGPVTTFADGLSSITVSAIGGKATFGNNVAFGTPGTYTLSASDSTDGATPVDSGLFNVIQPGAVPTLAFHVPPPASVQAGTVVSPPVVVYENLNGSLDTADSSSFVSLEVNNVTIDTTQVTQGVATFSNLVFPNTGSFTLVAYDNNDGTASANITVTQPPTIATLFFGPQPITPAVGSLLNPTITVTQKDSHGNPIADSSFVTLSVSGGTLNGSLTAQVQSNGVATFTGLSPSATGNYTLTAYDGNDNVGTLGFTVASTELVFTQQPQSFTITQGVPDPTFKVSVEQNGVIINDSSTIQVTVLFPAAASYGGTLSVPAVNGTATFNNFFLGNLIYEDYSIILQAKDVTNPSIASNDSASFSVTPGAPHTLDVYGGGTTAVGSTIDPGFQFEVYDQFNDIISTDTSSVVASIASGPGGTLGGSANGSINGGVNNLAINNVAGYYGILFTDAADGLTAVAPVTIVGGPATHLVFLQQPSTTSTSFPIQPPIEVEAEDAFNNLASNYTGMVTLSVLTPSGTQLSGPITVEAQNGLATFSGVSIGQIGSYTLSAVDSITASIAGTSNSFNIVAPVTLYVDKHAAGGNGLSWSAAFNNLQSALNAAVPGDTIDVAQGDYSPGVTPGSNATDTFQLEDGITIQGGFETGGANGPNPTAYPTVLDGLGVDYHVVTASGTNSTALLEGVTITNGNASGAGDADSGFGGGLIADGGYPTILNCILTSNTAVSGGAMYLANEGAISATVENCSFVNNTASTQGGAVYIFNSSPILLDILFAGNSATQSGGAIYDFNSSPTFTNDTFIANSAQFYGGAIENDDASIPVITNSIFWTNYAGYGGSDIANDQVSYQGGSESVINYSDVNFNGGYYGSYIGRVGNLNDVNPLFAPGGGNYQLQEISPCINVGNNSAPALPGIGTDLAGNPRVIDGVVDMGVFEAQLVAVSWTGSGDGINWSDPGNWSDKLVPTQFDDVTIGAGFTSIQVGAGTYAVHTLNASSPVELTAGTLVLFGSSTFGSGVTIDNGAQLDVVQSDPLTLTVSSLNINPGGSLDLADNKLLINYGSGTDPIASIAAWIASGYAGGSWNGSGIISTTAQSNSLTYGLGYADAADPGNPANLASGTIEIMYTLLGDANLDGKVNGTDFNILSSNFNTGGDSWDQGDFTYDGKVNGSDFNLLSANFNQGITLPASATVPASSTTVLVTPPSITSTVSTGTPATATVATNPPANSSTTSTTTASPTKSTVTTTAPPKSVPGNASAARKSGARVRKAISSGYYPPALPTSAAGSTASNKNIKNADAKFLAKQ